MNADGQGLPANNANFLRPSAHLAVIIFSNEDDCSAPPDTDLFDTSSKNVSDTFGPLQSYRCNEFGHLCNGARPPRTMTASFDPGACVPAETSGRLIPVATIASELKSLKSDPRMVSIAAIAGPPDPYAVVMVDAQAGTADAANGVKWPNVAHSCMTSADHFADPGVRIKALLDAFGDQGIFIPACMPDFVPVLQDIGAFVLDNLSGNCLASVPAGVDPLSPSVPPSCTATTNTGVAVSRCPSASGAPCLSFVVDPTCHATQLALSLQAVPTSAAFVSVRCSGG